MPRILVYGWLTILAPLHVGMAMPLLHPALAEREYFPLALGVGLLSFGGVVALLWLDRTEKSWKWAGKRFLCCYLLPLLISAAAQVCVHAYEAGEFGRFGESLRSQPSSNRNGKARMETPPASATRPVERVPRIIASWIEASAKLLWTLVSATPLWLYLVALAYGLLRFES